MKEITGSGIFVANGEDDALEVDREQNLLRRLYFFLFFFHCLPSFHLRNVALVTYSLPFYPWALSHKTHGHLVALNVL